MKMKEKWSIRSNTSHKMPTMIKWIEPQIKLNGKNVISFHKITHVGIMIFVTTDKPIPHECNALEIPTSLK